MRPCARLAALGSALTLGACAVIAGLDDPQAIDDATSASSSSGSVQDTGNGSSGSTSGGSSGTPGDSSSDDGASSSGTPGDAQPDVPPCTLVPNGDSCNQPSQCCSAHCNEQKKCTADCANEGAFNCAPGSTNQCCVGLWCNNLGGCVACITGGQPAALAPIVNLPMATSCCSRQLQGGTGPNCQ